MTRRRALTFVAFVAIAVGCKSPQAAPAPPAPPAASTPAERPPESIAAALQLRDDEARYTEMLERLIHAADTTTSRRARALYAIARADAGDHEGAIPLLASATEESPLLAPTLQLQLCRSRAAAGDPRGALDAARTVIATYPDSGASIEARLVVPTLAIRAEEPSAAATLVDAALGVPFDSFSEPLLVALADALDTLHRPNLAMKIRLRLVERYPRGRHFEQLFARVLHPVEVASPFSTMTVSQLASLAERAGNAGHADEGLELITILQSRRAKGAHAERVRIATARLYYKLRRYDSLLKLRFKPKSPYFAELQLMRARAYWRLDRDKEFLQVVNALIRRPPSEQANNEARELLARYHSTTTGDHVKAATIFGVLVARGATGDDGELLWEQAWQLLLAGDDDEALATLDRYLKEWPDAAYTANALFWKAKLLGAHGDIAGRDETFTALTRERPYDYFTWRARQLASLPTPAGGSIPDALPFPDVQSSPHLTDVRAERARELNAVGMPAHAAREWASLARSYPSDTAVTFHYADALARAGEVNRAIQIVLAEFRDVARHGASNVPPRFWEILYPRANWEAITGSAAKRNLDPWLVAAIIRQESAFEPSVVSGAGAVGMMQIMPDEASRIASSEGTEREVTRDELFDPATNIELGTIELRGLLDRLDGNEVLAVASYNAGEAAVKRWTDRQSIESDLDRFVESIPFAETRLYVKIVMKNREEYRRIYGEGDEAREK